MRLRYFFKVTDDTKLFWKKKLQMRLIIFSIKVSDDTKKFWYK